MKLPIWDEQMLHLMRHCIDLELCDSQKEFLESIGFTPANLRQVRNRSQSFTLEQIRCAAVKYKVNLNWIFGLDTDMKLKKPEGVLVQLKDAVRSLEATLSRDKTGTKRAAHS